MHRTSVFCLALFMLLVTFAVNRMAQTAPSPAPFFRTRTPRLTQPAIPAQCIMEWGNHKAETTFGPNGDYRCKWFSMVFIGTWRYDHKAGILSIIESANPENPDSWLTYIIDIKLVEPGTWHGKVRSRDIPIKLLPCQKGE